MDGTALPCPLSVEVAVAAAVAAHQVECSLRESLGIIDGATEEVSAPTVKLLPEVEQRMTSYCLARQYFISRQ